MEGTNSAGEAMDELLNSGGMYDLDDSFPTLEEDENGYGNTACDDEDVVSEAAGK